MAQKFFDQGLALIFGFNHDEAARLFARAAELDPKSPMPHWGIALALGPNYNLPPMPEREEKAWKAIETAIELAKSAPANERAYVEALVKRYSKDPNEDRKQLGVAYKDAMGEVMRRYPDDLDAATLYAESLMNLRPWQLWSADGLPAEGTLEIIEVLEGVLRRDPNHPGANHYYIHAVEASKNPERALPSAMRLGSLMPGAGHIVHMPSHIFLRVGDHEIVRDGERDGLGSRSQVHRALRRQGCLSADVLLAQSAFRLLRPHDAGQVRRGAGLGAAAEEERRWGHR